MNEKTQRGFTLYELLITIVIIGVVLSVGIPGFTDFRSNARMTGAANDLHSSFQLARSEAARSKTNVTICASGNSLDLVNAACGGEFEAGWIVFEDDDGDVVRDAGEAVLRSYPEMDTAVDVLTGGGLDYFSYAPTGLGRGPVGPNAEVGVIRLCDHRGNIIASGGLSTARVLVVTPIGRATVLRDVAQINAQGGCP